MIHRLLLGLAPALMLVLAACGGGSETVPSDTATAAHTPVPTSGSSTAAPTGDGATASPNDGSTSMPELPPGAVAVSEYHVFPPAGGQGSILFTANITQAIPDGAKTYWYTYVDGQWQQLLEAYITAGRNPSAQNSFDVTPKNLVVLALQP